MISIKFEEDTYPYSRKIWRGIKFGGLADISETAKFNSADCSTFVMKQ